MDQNECADDVTCEHGCQVELRSSYLDIFRKLLSLFILFFILFFSVFVELNGKLPLRLPRRIRPASILQSVYR